MKRYLGEQKLTLWADDDSIKIADIKNAYKGLQMAGFKNISIIVYSRIIDIDRPKFYKLLDDSDYRRMLREFGNGKKIDSISNNQIHITLGDKLVGLGANDIKIYEVEMKVE